MPFVQRTQREYEWLTFGAALARLQDLFDLNQDAARAEMAESEQCSADSGVIIHKILIMEVVEFVAVP